MQISYYHNYCSLKPHSVMLFITTTWSLKQRRHEYNGQDIIGFRTFYAGSYSSNSDVKHDELKYLYYTEISLQLLNCLAENA